LHGAPATFWGKLRRDKSGTVVAWHPLADHCADVAACCESLLERTLLRSRLANLAGLDDFLPVHRARLCVLAALHDAGKVNLGFQRKGMADSRDCAGHVGEVFELLSATRHRELELFSAAVGGEEITRWGAEQLLYASLAHHGKPVPFGGGGHHRPALWAREGDLEPFAMLSTLAAAARRWFPEALTEGAPFSDIAQLQHAFSGLVTLADWLGSDQQLFPYSEEGDGDRITFSRARALDALRRIGLDAEPAREVLCSTAPTFQDVFDFPPRAAQEIVAGLAVPTSGGGLEILEAETGSGKTEAAVARFLALFAAGRVDGMYFALPTRTAATQIHRRITNYIARAFSDPKQQPPVVLAVPGYVRVDDVQGTALPGFQTLWPPDEDDRWRFRGWAAERPKRFLAGSISIGTVDQALLSTLTVKHSHLRATSLFRQFLVVDEVHASDAYMNRILEALLARHLAAGGNALLMSATLGTAARTRFLARDRDLDLPSLAEARNIGYPIVTVDHGAGAVTHLVEAPKVARSVKVCVVPIMDNANRLARAALAAARRKANVLVIRNTVGGAVAAQEALEDIAARDAALLFSCAGVATLHHSRFTREDRTELDRTIEERFGKESLRGGCVAIATQTVQQSLDLDADLLVTDLCPMDVLLQRIGRLHRHSHHVRASGFKHPRVILLVPAERDLGRYIRKNGEARGPHGLGTVYPDLRILEATWRIAEEKQRFEIPAMNRDLVERTTHPAALDGIVAELGESWPAHSAAIRGIAIAHGAQANVNLVDWSKPFVDTIFPDTDERVSTRLGAGDRIAQFPEPFVSPFGQRSREIPISATLAKGACEDEAPAEVTVSVGVVSFRFGKKHFLYDRLGLRTDAPPKEEEDLADA